jgi:hypothetical protein
MSIASATAGSTDRRWYPASDPVDWARHTRKMVYESVRRCIAGAISRPGALDVSDDTFRELHICVEAHARGLYALGQTEDGVVGLIVAAADDASQPLDLHPAVGAAIAQWCREAGADFG